MSVPTTVSDIATQLREQADVRTVFGEPVVAEGRTVIPVARVAYGFGGGYGEGDSTGAVDMADRENAATEREREPAAVGRGEGGGLGGGLVATPVGVVELTPTGTRFVRPEGRWRLVAGLGLGAVLGYLAGRRRGGTRGK